MRVAEGIHLVGGGWLGCGLSSAFDSNVYLLEFGGDAVLVDAGCGLADDAILANIDATGVARESVSRILLTHAHADHAAGAASLADTLGAEVWASDATAKIVSAGDEDASGLEAAKRAGTYPAHLRLRPTEVAQRLGDATVSVGEVEVEIVPTPGHAADHISLLLHVADRCVLLAGDAVFARGRVVLLADSDLVQLRASIQRLERSEPEVMLAGHGELVLRGATTHLAAAREKFDLGAVPSPFVV